MTVTHPAPAPHVALPTERTTVVALLGRGFADLGARIDRDGIDSCRWQVGLVADAVRPTSPALAGVLTGRYPAVVRERALGRARRLVLLRASRHAELALALAEVAP